MNSELVTNQRLTFSFVHCRQSFQNFGNPLLGWLCVDGYIQTHRQKYISCMQVTKYDVRNGKLAIKAYVLF